MREVFESAVRQPVDRRARFVEEACGRDPFLISEVQRMLAADAETHSLLDGHLLSVQVLREGDRFASHFEISGTLGRCGMGEVYLARETRQPYSAGWGRN